MTQPITLYAAKRGANPPKVEIVLRELGLDYETRIVDYDTEIKHKPYTDINPNGRVPSIYDPNTDLTLWESGAIVEYLIETYDKTRKISFASAPEKWHALQFLHFQTSGQGPYFGQFGWFKRFHPEQIPSAIDRYINEIDRVTMVLNNCLEGKEYLVGGKCSFADLSFVVWYHVVFAIGGDTLPNLKEKYPNWAAWLARLESRASVQGLGG